jgi:hypothetical protein
VKVFVDTWGLKALFDLADRDHEAAHAYRNSVAEGEAGVSGFVTSDFILDEAMTLVRMDAGHREAISVLDSVRESPFYEITPVDRTIFEEAVEMFRRHEDKRWSFTDCTSFVLMRREGLTEAFTFDRNFKQAGFTIVPDIRRDPGRTKVMASSSTPRDPAGSPPRGTPGSPRPPSRRAKSRLRA